MGTMTIKGKTMRSVDVDWKEFYYTNCPLISPSNVDQELGWGEGGVQKMASRTSTPVPPPRTTGTCTMSTTSIT